MTAIFGSGSLARRPRLTPRFSSTAIFLPSIAPFWRRGRDTKRTPKGHSANGRGDFSGRATRAEYWWWVLVMEDYEEYHDDDDEE